MSHFMPFFHLSMYRVCSAFVKWNRLPRDRVKSLFPMCGTSGLFSSCHLVPLNHKTMAVSFHLPFSHGRSVIFDYSYCEVAIF